MERAPDACPQCRHNLPPRGTEPYVRLACPTCGTALNFYQFPALTRPAQALRVEGLDEQAAACFYHPSKKAVASCDACGRFLCALCEVEWDGKRLCPGCLETGGKKRSIKSLENQRVLYDQIALHLVALPLISLILVYFTVLTAPIALFMVARYWKAPLSLVSRSKWRFVTALVLAGLEIGGWVWVFLLIYVHSK